MAEGFLSRAEIVELDESELLAEYERFARYCERKAEAQREAMKS